MTDKRTARCAGHAQAALIAYGVATGSHPADVDTVSDLICDLGHWCERNGVSFLGASQRGIAHWASERKDPESIEPMPEVSIRITPPATLSD